MTWADCSIFSVPELGNSCLRGKCVFVGQRGRWCLQSEAGGDWTEQLAGSGPLGMTGLGVVWLIWLSVMLNTSESLHLVHLLARPSECLGQVRSKSSGQGQRHRNNKVCVCIPSAGGLPAIKRSIILEHRRSFTHALGLAGKVTC